jgi:hypothetical protein
MEETPVLRPVPVPEGILQNLKEVDQSVQRCLENDHLGAPPASWFVASQIHLDGPNEIDLVVASNGGCLLGANVAPFWIYRSTLRGYELVLAVDVHDLEVLRSRWKGFREIRVWSMTVDTITTETFRFGGQFYSSYLRISKPIK